jgi:hypothetical protein
MWMIFIVNLNMLLSSQEVVGWRSECLTPTRAIPLANAEPPGNVSLATSRD